MMMIMMMMIMIFFVRTMTRQLPTAPDTKAPYEFGKHAKDEQPELGTTNTDWGR